MNLEKTLFGNLGNSKEAYLFTLSNDNNVTVKITNYGAIITSIVTPDKNSGLANIVCGFNNLETYLSSEYLGSYPYFGCIIGRFGNRIAGGKLVIKGKEYQMAINNGPNHLHGGKVGFDRKLWDYEPISGPGEVGVKLTYLSPDGEENYPGNLKATCVYTLNNKNELTIEYIANTDKTTAVNLTNHSYFNLTGGKENILNHKLQLNASHMTEMVEQIPNGKIVAVEGTPFDFSEPKTFKSGLGSLPQGYDDNFVLQNDTGGLKFTGTLSEETTGRKVDIYTTQPGIQLYTGYWIPELKIGGVKKFGRYAGVALETQHYPDSVNQPGFPSTILEPSETYNEKTIYKFG